MKNFLITTSFITVFAFTSNAQDTKSNSADKPVPKKEEPATLKPASAPQSTDPQPQATESRSNKGGTRMAITEKGVPASKNTEPAKTQKATEPKKAEGTKTEKH